MYVSYVKRNRPQKVWHFIQDSYFTGYRTLLNPDICKIHKIVFLNEGYCILESLASVYLNIKLFHAVLLYSHIKNVLVYLYEPI
jgi:hypothetical protein